MTAETHTGMGNVECCTRCEKPMLDAGLGGVCDTCVAVDGALFYSLAHLELTDARIAAARAEAEALGEKGLGHDRRSNPTKGRSRLNAAQSAVERLSSQSSLIRSVLIGRGEVEPELEESLDHAFPEAKNNQLVDWKGVRYRHNWIHEGMDHTGRNVWGRAWTRL